MSFRQELVKHLTALPVKEVKRIISKYNKELDIKGYSKMKKAEVIQFVKGKKPMDKVLLAKLTKEAEKARKSNSKSKPDFDFDDDDTKLSKSNKSLALKGDKKEPKAGGGDAMFKAVISKDGKTIHTSPLTNKKIGTIMDMTKPWNYKQGKNLKKFNINGKSLAMIGKGVKIEIKDRDGKVVKSRTI